MNPIVSHLLVLLVGCAVGAIVAIQWKITNDRRQALKAEDEAEEDFHQLEARMPGLIAEMRADLGAPETRLLREFLAIEGGAEPEPNDPTLAYSSAKHADLGRHLDLLKKHHYIVEIPSETVPRFRMTEEFVELILKKKDSLRYRAE